jgi:hypothetical protein
MKQEVDYIDPTNKDNIYDNPLQEIPEYMSLGDDSGLDSNDFEYLPVLRYLSLRLETPETQVEDDIFEESDIERVTRLDLRQESLPDLFYASIIIVSDDPLDALNLFLVPTYIASPSELSLLSFLGYMSAIEPFEPKIL